MYKIHMANFISYDRWQAFLLPHDLREWAPEDDPCHFIIEAVERIPIGAFKVNWKGTGKAQYHPRMMPALLIYCYANGIFSSRRIEKATFRDVAADTHPDHNTVATLRRENQAAFASVLEMARELELFKVGMVSIDGTGVDANASKIRSVRYDRAKELRARLEAKLDAARARLEAKARERAGGEQAAYEKKLAGHRARNGQGRGPKPPDDTPDPDKQSNLTNPDSNLMRKSNRHECHEYRQAYNAQAVVDADGSRLVLAGTVSQNAGDAPGFEAILAALCDQAGRPATALGDAGFANGEAIKSIETRKIEVPVAVSRPDNRRTYDFRPLKPDAKPPPEPEAEWRRQPGAAPQ